MDLIVSGLPDLLIWIAETSDSIMGIGGLQEGKFVIMAITSDTTITESQLVSSLAYDSSLFSLIGSRIRLFHLDNVTLITFGFAEPCLENGPGLKGYAGFTQSFM